MIKKTMQTTNDSKNNSNNQKYKEVFVYMSYVPVLRHKNEGTWMTCSMVDKILPIQQEQDVPPNLQGAVLLLLLCLLHTQWEAPHLINKLATSI